MRLPRDISSDQLIALLKHQGFNIVKQKGSHIRLNTQVKGDYSITIPAHNPIKIGTLNAILNDLSEYLGISKEDLIAKLI